MTSCASLRKVDYSIIKAKPDYTITRATIDSLLDTIECYHPDPYGDFTKVQIDSIASRICKDNKDKKLTVTDYALQLRRIVDKLAYNDPHLICYPLLEVTEKPKFKIKNIRFFPFDIHQIKDTAIITKTYNDKLQKGDRVVSVNGIKIEELLKYSFATFPRYDGFMLQLLSQKTISPIYKLEIVRKGKLMKLDVKGKKYGDILNEKFCDGKLLSQCRTGYFKIKEFTYNKNILKQMKKNIDKTIAAGYKNFIIDLRGNPGGSGDRLDEFFSVMSNKDSLSLSSGQYLKVSTATINDYDFVKNEPMGKVVRMPDSLIFKKFALIPELYKGKMNYYVIIDKATSSTAAMFANIMQYNNIGKLVGEPLAHNAIFCGDITSVRAVNQVIIISTTKDYELTKSNDGYVYPDIAIPYIAKEYEKYDDPELTKLLEIIARKER